jgi:hypothetical protein
MPERQCHGCTRQKDWGCEAERFVSDKTDRTAQPDAEGVWWGWTKPSNLPLTLDGEDTYACPRQDVRARPQAWHRMLLYYGMYKKGFLPQTGSVMDQSNKAVELFRLFDEVNFECDSALAAEQTVKRQLEQQPGQGKGRRRG